MIRNRLKYGVALSHVNKILLKLNQKLSRMIRLVNLFASASLMSKNSILLFCTENNIYIFEQVDVFARLTNRIAIFTVLLNPLSGQNEI